MARKTISIPIAELVEDMEFYPRHAVDEAHVAALFRALESGATLPPPVVDRKSKRVVDGWHRIRAHRRLLGSEGVIDVEPRSYPNDAAMILDAVALNSGHGRKLDSIDVTRSVIMLERHGFQRHRIASALHVTETHVERIRLRVATAPAATEEAVPGTRKIALKRSVGHLEGRKLTPEQALAHNLMPGTSFILLARQLTEALRADMIDLEDEKLITALRELGDELHARLAAA